MAFWYRPGLLSKHMEQYHGIIDILPTSGVLIPSRNHELPGTYRVMRRLCTRVRTSSAVYVPGTKHRAEINERYAALPKAKRPTQGGIMCRVRGAINSSTEQQRSRQRVT